MRSRRVAVLFMCAFAGSLSAASVPDYSVAIEQSYVPHSTARRVALLPLACPEAMQCADLEASYLEQLASGGQLTVVGADAVRELALSAGLDKLSEQERRPILAEGLKVDGFVKIDILRATVDRQPPAANDKWRELRNREESVTSLKIEVRLIAKDGTLLAQASGDAHLVNSIKSLNSVAARTFQHTLDKLFSTDA